MEDVARNHVKVLLKLQSIVLVFALGPVRGLGEDHFQGVFYTILSVLQIIVPCGDSLVCVTPSTVRATMAWSFPHSFVPLQIIVIFGCSGRPSLG